MTEQEKEILYAAVMKRANQKDTFGVENGMRIVAMGEGWARGELHTEVRHGNPMGIVHGGVYCTLLDQVAGAAVGEERDVKVTFPTEYVPELAGKDAVFHI